MTAEMHQVKISYRGKEEDWKNFVFLTVLEFEGQVATTVIDGGEVRFGAVFAGKGNAVTFSKVMKSYEVFKVE